MTRPCCTGEAQAQRFARPRAGAAASILPGAVLLLLPKCPLCLAAWLTAATGIGFPAAAAAGIRGLIVAFWVAAVALAAVQIIRRRLKSWTYGDSLPSVRLWRQWRKVLSTASRARANRSISARIHSKIPPTALPIDC